MPAVLISRFVKRRPLDNPWSDTLLLNMTRSSGAAGVDKYVSESTSLNAAAMLYQGRNYGKFYWETQPSSASFDCANGIRRVDEPITTAINLGKTLAMRYNGTLFTGDTGASTGTGASYGSNQRLMHALDLVAMKYWIGVAGTWANSGNPAAGTNPLFSGFPAGEWRPYFWADNSAGNHQCELTNGQVESAFGFTIPDGFEAGIRY